MAITSIAASDKPADSRTVINDNFTNLAIHHKGPSAPSSPAAGYIWLDDDTPSSTRWSLKAYDGTDWITLLIVDATNNRVELPSSTQIAASTMTGNLAMGTYIVTGHGSGSASTDLVNKGQIDGRIHVSTVSVDGISATVNIPLIAAPSAIVISDVKIISDTATTGSSAGVNDWSFQVANVTAGNNLKASAKLTSGGEISANTTYSLGLDQNLTLASSDVLRLVVTKTGTPTSLTSAKIQVQVNYKVTT